MNYDVLEESKHAVENLEQNAWENHKEEYVNAKSAADDFRDRIDAEEYAIKNATTDKDVEIAQEELTKIIDDILKFNDEFNSSLITVNTDTELMNPDDAFQLDTKALDSFLANMEE